MTRRVADSAIADFACRQHDWMERVLKGSLDPEEVSCAVQAIINRGGYRLTIDYGQTLEQMIAAGRYDWKNDDISVKRFPLTGSGVVERKFKIFHFDRLISSDEAERLIIADGWQAAKIEHLLAFGAEKPDEQRKFLIVALGSVAGVGGDPFVPYLGGDAFGRGVGLDWRGAGWGAHCRFLAVRNF